MDFKLVMNKRVIFPHKNKCLVCLGKAHYLHRYTERSVIKNSEQFSPDYYKKVNSSLLLQFK